MKVTVVGLQKVSYTSKKTNREVNGISLYYTRYPNSRESGTEGLVSGKEWISSNLISQKGYVPKVGQIIDLEYEFDGRSVSLFDYHFDEGGE